MKRSWIAGMISVLWLALFTTLAMPRGGESLLVAVSLHLRSFGVLIGLRSSVEDIVEFEFRRGVQKNPQLATADPDVIARHRAEIRDNTMHRFDLLRRALGYSFLIILTACVAGALVIIFGFDKSLRLLLSLARVCAIASMFCFAWATLGRLGWAGQSYRGDTIVEMLDELLFRLLYALGASLGTAAALLL